jgi:UDP-N-acetylmuramoylalanine--D-glutamate ligase
MRPATADKTLIVGLGATGLSVARFLAARGQPFAVADTRAQPPGLSQLREIDERAEVHLGAFAPDLFANAARVVLSPGVALREPAVQEALTAGIEVIGDIELFAREIRAPLAAVSGSNGKSTVTTLLAEMARADGRLVRAGGNLGTPALDLIEDPEPELYVLELSSFQLETTQSLRPAAAVVLNLSADHLDRYNGLADYAAAKARIYRHAQTRVVNRDDHAVLAMTAGADTISFGLDAPADGHYGLRVDDGRTWLCRGESRLLAEDELHIAGRHNTANALAALALGRALGLSARAMHDALRNFAGLPHRTQWIGARDGVDWYNDSKATNVGATLAALSGMPGPVVLIAGGDGKGQDFAPLRRAAHKLRAVVLIGRDAGLMAAALKETVPLIPAADMDEAVATAARLARSSDQVLLAPACASLDMYSGYAERGEHFMSAARRFLS